MAMAQSQVRWKQQPENIYLTKMVMDEQLHSLQLRELKNAAEVKDQ